MITNKRYMISLWALLFFLIVPYTKMIAQENQAKPKFVPTDQYYGTYIEGWVVRINKHLLTDKRQIGSQAINLLKTKLNEIEKAVPTSACAKLKTIPIWLGVNDGYAPCTEYHLSREWLTANGYNPAKAKSVEIGNAQLFLKWSQDQPSMVLHELAHGYFDQYLKDAYPEIREAYEKAFRSGIYNSVRRNNGRTERAYAMTNEQEYFAESTEAFFGTNDFFPFNRKELKAFDPDMYNLLKKVWGI